MQREKHNFSEQMVVFETISVKLVIIFPCFHLTLPRGRSVCHFSHEVLQIGDVCFVNSLMLPVLWYLLRTYMFSFAPLYCSIK